MGQLGGAVGSQLYWALDRSALTWNTGAARTSSPRRPGRAGRAAAVPGPGKLLYCSEDSLNWPVQPRLLS